MTHDPALMVVVAKAIHAGRNGHGIQLPRAKNYRAPYLADAAAALDAIAAAGRLVPDGWVAVPREATDAMERAAVDRDPGPFRVETLYQSIYRAMVAAASAEDGA